MKHPLSLRLVCVFACVLSAACSRAVTVFDGSDAGPDAPTSDAPVRDAPVTEMGADAPPTNPGLPGVVIDLPAAQTETWALTTIAAPIGCSPGAWCWEHPTPRGEAIFGTYARAADDVWAVGGHGTAMRWDGAQWRYYTTNTRATLTSVYAASANDAWFAGYEYTDERFSETRRVFLRFDGTGFGPVGGLDASKVTLVRGSGPSDVWAVLQQTDPLRSELWRYDGTAWSQVTAALPAEGLNVRDLQVERAGRVWMYGTSPRNGATRVLRYEGGRIAATYEITRRAIQGSLAVANGVVLAYAEPSPGSGLLLRFGETTFTEEVTPDLPDTTFSTVLVGAGGRHWFLGRQDVYRLDATGWTHLPLPRGALNVRGPQVLAAGDSQSAWAFNYTGDVFRAEAGAFALQSSPDKPRLFELASEGAVPTYAMGEAVLQRGPTGAWSRAPFSVAGATAAVASPNGALYLLVEGAVREALGRETLQPAIATDVTALAATAGELWLAGPGSVRRVRAPTGDPLPVAPLPAQIETGFGADPLTRAEWLTVYTDGTETWVGGGIRQVELENDYVGVLCRYRDRWTCAAMRGSFTMNTGGVMKIANAGAGSIWVETGAGLYRFDRETFAPTRIRFGETELTPTMHGASRSGALVFSDGRSAYRAEPSMRAVSRFTVPLSFYAGYLRGAATDDAGDVWVMGENSELLRYEAP